MDHGPWVDPWSRIVHPAYICIRNSRRAVNIILYKYGSTAVVNVFAAPVVRFEISNNNAYPVLKYLNLGNGY
eukprot:SAG31_NODE_1454_length_8278_cov_7.030688_6_plen_72_part_00